MVDMLNNIDWMPYLFKVEIKESPIHGRGVFAAENIPKGATFWAFPPLQAAVPTENFESLPNEVLTMEDLHKLKDEKELMRIINGGINYKDAKVFLDFRDGTQFTNHSSTNWNSQTIFEGSDYRKLTIVACKQIKVGDQITENYLSFWPQEGGWYSSELFLRFNQGRKFYQELGRLFREA